MKFKNIFIQVPELVILCKLKKRVFGFSENTVNTLLVGAKGETIYGAFTIQNFLYKVNVSRY